LAARDRVGLQHNAELWWELATPSEKIKLLLTMALKGDKTPLRLITFLALQRMSKIGSDGGLNRLSGVGRRVSVSKNI
jgi:hypothetical protein